MKINSTHPYADRSLDMYPTPPEATRALMAIEKLPLSVLDPCCGTGAILDVLRGDHIVFGSDIVDYGWPGTEIYDYLVAPIKMNGAGIVTNPPYKLALKFIQKAIADDCQYHAWLLRANFLESVQRKPFFDANPPTRIHISSRRLPMTHRLGWDGPTASSNVSYCWMIWDPRGGDNRPQLNWFDWQAIKR